MQDNGAKGAQGSKFEQLAVGDSVTPLVRGPMTPVRLMRWSAATENWHRIHYDLPFARDHEQLPGLLINGSWKQHFVVQMMHRWLGPGGWLAEIEIQFRAMDVAGETLTAHGEVTSLEERHGFGWVECAVGILDSNGRESTPGSALGVLPLAGGPEVPYPFPAELLDG